MKIVSVLKEVFQEYPDEVSLGVFCYACQFRCTYCHNLGVVLDPKNIIGDFDSVYANNITPMHTAVVISGGEPTVWGKKLINAAELVKHDGLKVKLFTNGYDSTVIRWLAEKRLIDSVSMDFKGVKDLKKVLGVNIDDGSYLWRIWKSANIIVDNGIPLEFRVTKYPGIDIDLIVHCLQNTLPHVPVIFQECVEYANP